ncbi:uncharacterized protein LTR77_009160 [Saxophila tyrrhenica]|uniref:ASST-domain-containing protein n=1 Tax=Saxophila tyrrhenica TaxID=1690608 RepID=A0AAV9P2E7_9PEZI|nr:hypothetical protein LTR77_009160 [Saxophila tyrrhenica]
MLIGASSRATCCLSRALLVVLPALLSRSGTLVNAEYGLFSFVSRPDIHAPKWDIDVYDEAALAPGYWFVGPYLDRNKGDAPDDGYVGPHIYDQDGSLIWSPVELEPTWNIRRVEAFTLSQVDMGTGGGVESMLTANDMRKGKAMILDNHYQLRRHDWANGGWMANSHELNFVDDGTKALIVFSRTGHKSPQEQLDAAGIEEQCKVSCNGIAEYDAKTWERGWTWSSCEGHEGKGHIDLEESQLYRGHKCPHDYVHANSADKTAQGDYLLSCRHTNALYKISRKDGRIVWRLGGTKSDFVHIDDFVFSRQHMVRYRGGNETHTMVSILDNAWSNDGNMPSTYENSRGLMIALDESSTPMTAQVVAQYDHPDGNGNFAFRRGGMQVLPNGNVFMGWSENGIQSEHSENGTLLMRARFRPTWLGTYRAFKYNGFVGMPNDPPDVVARYIVSSDRKASNKTQVFVSWNGATEVDQWRLLETNKYGERGTHISTIKKSGFEGKFEYAGDLRYIVVEALARNGSVLSTSDTVIVRPTWYEKLLHNPIFIAAVIITVAAALILTATWWVVTRLRRRGGTSKLAGQSRFFDRLTKGRYQKISDQKEEGGEGSEPLMRSDEGWTDDVEK